MTEDTLATTGFTGLGLSSEVLKALDDIGYEAPSAIQALTIPPILEGHDLVGQAQTGTGKTAAFALPLLTKLKSTPAGPQILVLVPTRELAIQVAEAFQRYAAHIPGFHVLPIYGGQGYGGQLHQLKRGVHVVVATPGRLCDHLRRGTLALNTLTAVVIDEADEMLRMGFIDEVEWILEQTPKGRQVALFSATMAEPIRRIAKRHLKEPVEITVRPRTAETSAIRQRYWMVSGLHKLDALTRILEGEDFEAMIVFVRTKSATIELSSKLEARGFSTAALNGDIPQHQREATVEAFRSGKLDILVATDVAARGLDVQRITHIINYDIPADTESYVHRIGRTGRAGRAGEAILFVAPRERRLLHSFEKATRATMEPMRLPTRESINDIRIARFKERITDTLAEEELGFYYQLIEDYVAEKNIPAIEVAAALAKLLQGEVPMLLDASADNQPSHDDYDDSDRRPRGPRPAKFAGNDTGEKELYRIEVGRVHNLKPGSVVGAIANEAGLDGKQIGRIDIQDDYSIVELPAGIPDETIRHLGSARVAGRPLRIALLDPTSAAAAPRPAARKSYAKPDSKFAKPETKYGAPAKGKYSADSKSKFGGDTKSKYSAGPKAKYGAASKGKFADDGAKKTYKKTYKKKG